MQQVHTVDELRSAVAAWRRAGESVALVPTMGNLHDGHMSLVSLAAAHAERIVVSVFVNPTQFGPNEDFDSYPRTLDQDSRKLAEVGVGLLFVPSVREVYPRDVSLSTIVSVPEITDQLCGAHRPGHFDGVTSVVCRLFNICSPDVAVFGQKDYQQLVVLRQMVADLHLPVTLIAAPTARSRNGLALSSRNGGLSEEDRQTACAIFETLEFIASELRRGRRDFVTLQAEAIELISASGLEPDYVEIRTADTLRAPAADSARLVVLIAARIGGVRLIDNLLVDPG